MSKNRSEAEYENELESATWRRSIGTMYVNKDLEGLRELADGPEELDDDLKEMLYDYIRKLEKEFEERTME